MNIVVSENDEDQSADINLSYSWVERTLPRPKRETIAEISFRKHI